MIIARKGNPAWKIHPGEILRKEFMEPADLTIYALAKELHVADPTVRNVVKERAAVTPDMAARLARFFGTTELFWLNLQSAYSLKEVITKKKAELDRIHPLAHAKGA